MAEMKDTEFYEQVVWINRVTKVVKGGKNFSFSALVVVGDRAGKVGYAMGKAREVPLAIQKAIKRAKQKMVRVPMVGTTIAHETYGENCGGRVLLKPAAPGTGVIAGGPVRAVLEAAGVRDVLTKSLGSSNPSNAVKATFNAISALRDLGESAKMRGKKLEDLELGDYVKKQIEEQEKTKYKVSEDTTGE